MKHVIHSIAFILVALMSTGCFGPSEKGRDFSVRETRSLVQGESTKADVRQLLGEPTETKQEGEIELWIYKYSMAHMTGAVVKKMKVATKVSVVSFDSEGIVQYAEIHSTSQSSTAFSSGIDMDSYDKAQVSVGSTTPQEVMEWLGPPQTETWKMPNTESYSYNDGSKVLTFNFEGGLLKSVEGPE